MEIDNQTTEIDTTIEPTIDETPSANDVQNPVEDAQNLAASEEFTPNYAYKAYGKEHEIEEWARPLINADNNDHFTKLYARAGGFDQAKEKLEAERLRNNGFEESFTNMNSQFSEITQQRDRLVKSVETGNLKETFNILGVNEDNLLDYAEQLARIKSGDRSYAEQFNQKYNNLTESMNSDFERQRFEQERETFQREQHDFEMQQTFQRPDVAPMIEEYNTRMNNPQAFNDVVQRIGYTESQLVGKDISVMEAVEKAKVMLGLGMQQQAPQMPETPQVPQAQMNPAPVLNKETPTPVPNFGGSGNLTPVKKRPMSIADLQKEYSQLTS